MPLDSIKQIELEEELALIENERGTSDNSLALSLVKRGWRVTYAELFGKSFVDVLDSVETDDRHHSEALEWHWNARLNLINYELELDALQNKYKLGVILEPEFIKSKDALQAKWYPDFWAYLAIWARGNMKTTLARFMTIVDALLSYAHNVRSYALIVGGTVKKVNGTAKSIGDLLQSDQVKKYAPALSVVQKNEQGASQGWTASFINTAAGCVFHFIGLDEGVAGANINNVRPTFIIPDDIDDREDSPVISDSRFQTLTRAVIPTKQWNTLFFFAQNLISRFAVLYRIWKQQVRVLANRYATEPVPAVRNLVTEERTVNGHVRDIFVSGEITWRGWNHREVQNQIDSMTLPVFLLECQHEVEQSKEGLMHKKYNDNVHPISYSQFGALYGSPDAWKDWAKFPFSDWARTKTKYHANVAGYLAISSANTRFPGLTFCVPLSFKAEAQPEDVAERLLSILTPYVYEEKTWRDLIDEAWKRMNVHEHFQSVAERLDYAQKYYSAIIPKYSQKILKAYRVRAGVNSHSEDKVRGMLNKGFGFSFSASNPGKTDALEDIDAAMRVDYNEPHLFDDAKKGYTRWYVLCKDDTTKEPKIIDGIKVYPPVPYPDVMSPDELHDDDLFRYQMCNRRFLDPELTKLGERIDEPLKLNDDFGQALQMVYYKRLLSNIGLSQEELVEEHMPAGLQKSALDVIEDPEKKGLTLHARLLKMKEIQGELTRPVKPAGINRIRRR
jgi:hypothetical protein